MRLLQVSQLHICCGYKPCMLWLVSCPLLMYSLAYYPDSTCYCLQGNSNLPTLALIALLRLSIGKGMVAAQH